MRGRGISERQVERGSERGDLARLHRGVYRLGPVALPYCLETAAVLASGPAAVLSHRSAPYVYGMLPRAEGPVHVTVRGEHRRGDAGIVVHTTSLLSGSRNSRAPRDPGHFADPHADRPRSRRHRRGARASRGRSLRAAPDEPRRAAARCQRHRGRRGVGRLQRLLQGGGPRRTRSGPERELLLRRPPSSDSPSPRRTRSSGAGRSISSGAPPGSSSRSTPTRPIRRRGRSNATAARMPSCATLGLRVQRFTADRVHNELDSVWRGCDNRV